VRMKGKKTGGRQKGTPNKVTKVFREAVLMAYDAIGGDSTFAEWARNNQTEFYKIAARLIPQDVAVSGELEHSYVVEMPVPA